MPSRPAGRLVSLTTGMDTAHPCPWAWSHVRVQAGQGSWTLTCEAETIPLSTGNWDSVETSAPRLLAAGVISLSPTLTRWHTSALGKLGSPFPRGAVPQPALHWQGQIGDTVECAVAVLCPARGLTLPHPSPQAQSRARAVPGTVTDAPFQALRPQPPVLLGSLEPDLQSQDSAWKG